MDIFCSFRSIFQLIWNFFNLISSKEEEQQSLFYDLEHAIAVKKVHLRRLLTFETRCGSVIQVPVSQ